MVVRVKICGIRNRQDAAMAVEEGADALGFVFAESQRRLSPREASFITKTVPPFVSRTGVFVNEKTEVVLEIAEICGLDTLQFHGEETPDYCGRFSSFRVIKSFAVSSLLSYDWVSRYRVDAVLLDTGYRDRKGGGGKTFDWRRALPFSEGCPPLILAGGLSSANVCAAVKTVRPYAVDVSSGVEEGGQKNRNKINAFIGEVRKGEKMI